MYSTLKFNFLSKEAITEKDYAELNALLKTCQEVDSTAIGLDVAAANERALHIYTSCGFEKQSVMDYYELNI